MGDHDRQDGLAGWMLGHLARALIGRGDLAQAARVCRRALALPRDGMTGIDGITMNLPANGHIVDRIGLLGEIGLAATAG